MIYQVVPDDLIDSATKVNTLISKLGLTDNLLASQGMLVTNQTLAKAGLTSDITLRIADSNFDAINGSTLYVKDGNQVIKTVKVDSQLVSLGSIANGIYTFRSSVDGLNFVNKYLYVKDSGIVDETIDPDSIGRKTSSTKEVSQSESVAKEAETSPEASMEDDGALQPFGSSESSGNESSEASSSEPSSSAGSETSSSESSSSASSEANTSEPSSSASSETSSSESSSSASSETSSSEPSSSASSEASTSKPSTSAGSETSSSESSSSASSEASSSEPSSSSASSEASSSEPSSSESSEASTSEPSTSVSSEVSSGESSTSASSSESNPINSSLNDVDKTINKSLITFLITNTKTDKQVTEKKKNKTIANPIMNKAPKHIKGLKQPNKSVASKNQKQEKYTFSWIPTLLGFSALVAAIYGIFKFKK